SAPAQAVSPSGEPALAGKLAVPVSQEPIARISSEPVVLAHKETPMPQPAHLPIAVDTAVAVLQREETPPSAKTGPQAPVLATASAATSVAASSQSAVEVSHHPSGTPHVENISVLPTSAERQTSAEPTGTPVVVPTVTQRLDQLDRLQAT